MMMTKLNIAVCLIAMGIGFCSMNIPYGLMSMCAAIAWYRVYTLENK